MDGKRRRRRQKRFIFFDKFQVTRRRKMSPKFKSKWRPTLFKLMLMIQLVACLTPLIHIEAAKRSFNQAPINEQSTGRARKPIAHPTVDAYDPMEPCYLSNNRASESLTISESTPVGTVVGEIMVNGDSSPNGNIELSIRMPSGSSQQQQASTDHLSSRNFRSSFSSAAHLPINSTATTSNRISAQQTASAKELSSLIDLMPPLTIEHDTKRLILAKKLDRENLDRYIAAGGYQSAASAPATATSSALGSSNSLSQSSSSASLTVHIKCQLRSQASMQTNGSSLATAGGKQRISLAAKSAQVVASSSLHSILIPVHLIVTDENDNWPVFIGAPYIMDLNESAPVGSPVAGNEIVAVDGDQQGPLSTIEYSIVPGSLWSDSFAFLNPLDSRSLVLKDRKLIDFESRTRLSLQVMARDQGEPPNWAIQSLYINLQDSDDSPPQFEEDKYLGYVHDNRPGEQLELQPKRMVARDGDRAINAPLVYSFHLKTNHSVHFDLDPEQGRLQVRKSLPEELSGGQPFCLLVRATQLDNAQRFSVTMVNVRLDKPPLLAGYSPGGLADANLDQLLAIDQQLPATGAQHLRLPSSMDQASAYFRFAQPNYTIQVSESAPPGFTLITLRAGQGEGTLQDDDQVNYHLLDDHMGYLTLDLRSGRLSLNKSLDYELYRQVTVRVLATRDEAISQKQGASTGELPRLVCDMAKVTLNIIPFNEFTPEFSHELYNFQLSVSDLIANFDLPHVREPPTSSPTGIEIDRRFNKRSGDLELNGLSSNEDNSALEEPLQWPAMQLGQVHCADRDFSDKISLHLQGSKAHLFHLTQSGRLYLPLVNTSTWAATGGSLAANLAQTAIARKSTGSANPSSWWNNNLLQGRLFSGARPPQQQENGPQRPATMSDQHILPDRNYLNLLLAEFSTLGRLRLKAVASDDGHQPQARQSTALIVITVISIDNFILQRATPQLPTASSGIKTRDSATSGSSSHQQAQDAIQLTNESSYTSDQMPGGQQQAGSRYHEPMDRSESQSWRSQQQVMMIPATDGRSFVQINSDIMSNLIANQDASKIQNKRPNVNGTGSSSQEPGQTTPMDQVTPGSQTNNLVGGQRQFQPPSLLLIDEDGAKFVAMPAAIEVYQQQVQEAAAQQQAARNKLLSSQEDNMQPEVSSLWSKWKSQFGLGAQQQPGGGALYWINLSTAIILHLLALVLVIALLSRIKWAASDGSTTGGRRGGFGALCTSLFSGWREGDEQTAAVRILEQASANYSSQTGAMRVGCAGSDHSSEGSSSSFGFPHCTSHNERRAESDLSPTNSDRSRQSTRFGRQVSAGVVVSVVSNEYKKCGNSSSSSNRQQLQSSKQQPQNLFGHLKLTLNRMLDTSGGSAKDNSGVCIGQMHIRQLDADSIKFDGFTTEQQHQICKESVLESSADKSKSLILSDNLATRTTSTFVGSSNSPSHQQNGSKQSPISEESASGDKKIVSINVGQKPRLEPSATKPTESHSPTQGTERRLTGSSSSSSVVSLISMSSSISNKINAAVQRSSGERAATGSDASSLDSTTLFSETQAKRVATAIETSADSPNGTGAVPPPPPPPPPPCLVQVGGRQAIESIKQAVAKRQVPDIDPMVNYEHYKETDESKPFSARPEVDSTASINSTQRRPLPQNPMHVKLKQQAAAMSQPEQQQLTSNRKQQQHRTQWSPRQSNGKLPPTPPPLPHGSSIKTVSPTTSVDRGYESFQSHSSFSQQPGRAQPSDSAVRNSRIEAARVLRASKTLASGVQLAASQSLVQSNPLQTTHQQRLRRVMQRTSGSDHYAHSQAAGRRLPQSSKLSGGRSAPGRRLQSSQPKVWPPVASQTNCQAEGHLDYETEDDDFYYCRSQLLATGPSGCDPLAAGNALSDYASHAYLTATGSEEQLSVMTTPPVAASKVQGRSSSRQLQNQSYSYLRGQQQNGADLMSIYQAPSCALHSSSISSSSPSSHASTSGGHRRRNADQRNCGGGGYSTATAVASAAAAAAAAAAASKKQLTWSDQVKCGGC